VAGRVRELEPRMEGQLSNLRADIKQVGVKGKANVQAGGGGS